MAHVLTELEVIPLNCFHGSGGGNIGHKAFLRTTDTAAQVEAANYLNASASRLPKGTTIQAVMAIGGTPVLKDYVVTVNTGTAVTIALAATTAG
jgi:hypothetical protein